MAFNGTGTFVRLYSWVTDAINGIFVSSSRMDADTNDIANGLSNCITKDGQTTVTANIPMAGFKFTGLGAGAASTDSVQYGQLTAFVPAVVCEFRLTLTAGTPVTTADVTGINNVFIEPYKGNHVALFDGSVWRLKTAVAGSIGGTAALAASTVYDVFLYIDGSGVVQSEVVAWTNDTTRATALTTQDGVLVKSGAVTRRYIGTFRTDGSKNVNDAYHLRHVWNYCNRVRRPMRRVQADVAYNYTNATIRQANANTANQLDCVVGVSEDEVSVRAVALAKNATLTGTWSIGIGMDTTTLYDTGCIGTQISSDGTAAIIGLNAFLNIIPAAGRHFFSFNEWGGGIGTTSWAQGAGFGQSGILGEMWG